MNARAFVSELIGTFALIFIGAGIGCIAAVARLPVLAFAVGVYLPLETMAAVFVGGMTRHLLTRNQSSEEAERRRERGVLFGSGLVGGGGLTGVLLAIWVGIRGGERIVGFPLGLSEVLDQILALATIVSLVLIIAWSARRSSE